MNPHTLDARLIEISRDLTALHSESWQAIGLPAAELAVVQVRIDDALALLTRARGVIAGRLRASKGEKA